MSERAIFARPNRIEVNVSAIKHNVAALRRLVGRQRKIFATLKANAYGFGLEEVARIMVEAGVDAISVADLGDAVGLREIGIEVPILYYGAGLATPETVAAVIRHRVIGTVHDRASADAYLEFANAPVSVFLKVNVGLERLGVEPWDAPEIAAALEQAPNIALGGVYVHLTMSGPAPDLAYLQWQFARLTEVLDALKRIGIEPPLAMGASSATLRETDAMCLGAIDPGGLLFNLDPPEPGKADLGLRAVLGAIKSRLITVRALARTERVAQAPFPVREGMRVGVMPIGRRDGFPMFNAGEVLVRGLRAALLGPASLEHSRIDLTGVPEAQVGDEVVIIGRQGAESITLDQVARHQSFGRPSDIAMVLSPGLPRVYLEGG